MVDRVLDRVARFDERSRNFPIRTVIDSGTFISKTWDISTWNDQGVEGACVGFGWSHELSATPSPVPTNNTIARSLYKRAQQLDVWPGESYEGTSVLGGAKAVSELVNNVGEKYISEYRWAFGLSDLLLAIAHQGPAVLGLNWYQGMFDTDSEGYIRVTGNKMGGHCLLAVGVVIFSESPEPRELSQIDLDRSYIVLHNSWGRSWGRNGQARITLRDMNRLLGENGDACVPMVRSVDQVIVPVVEDVNVPSPPPVPKPDVVVETKGTYFSVRRTSVFHGRHPGVRPHNYYDTREAALQSGLRPCNICRP